MKEKTLSGAKKQGKKTITPKVANQQQYTKLGRLRKPIPPMQKITSQSRFTTICENMPICTLSPKH